MAAQPIFSGLTRSTFDDANPSPYTDGVQKGVSEELVRKISSDKKEPQWMLDHRLACLQIYRDKPLPTWGPDLSKLDLDDIIYYATAGAGNSATWGEVPEEIRKVYDRLGIP